MKVVGRFRDDQYEDKGVDHIRKIVRAVVLDKDNHVALNKIYSTDMFGPRDYYELPGGGVKRGETLREALHREIEEEIGCRIDIVQEMGEVIDRYNLIFRENHNYFYLARVSEYVAQKLEEDEKILIEKVVWVDIDEAIRLCEGMQNVLVGRLVKQRELPILRKAEEIIKSL